MNICFIGYGNMAKALIKGLQYSIAKDAACSNFKLFVSSPRLQPGMTTTHLQTHSSNTHFIPEADMIILAVKPHIVAPVLREIAPVLSHQITLVSVVAGVDLTYLAKLTSPNQPIIRAMPNTPTAVGVGAAGLLANQWVNSIQKQQVATIFQYSGITTWLDEEAQIDAITALSGSGPAYVYLFAEALQQAATRLNLPIDLAQRFTLQTLKGAIALMEATEEAPAILRKKVTSAGGTTEAAINALENGQFTEIIYAAMQAAYHRAKALNQSIQNEE